MYEMEEEDIRRIEVVRREKVMKIGDRQGKMTGRERQERVRMVGDVGDDEMSEEEKTEQRKGRKEGEIDRKLS